MKISETKVLSLILVLFLLASMPWLMTVFDFPNREQRYSFISPQVGPTHAIFKALCKDTQPVDILILGSSLSMCALDPTILERELTNHLGRPSVVLNLSVHWRGEEIPFLLLKEILKQRKVKMLIWSSPQSITWAEEPHELAFHFWDNGSNFSNLHDLPLKNQLQYLTGSILSLPRLSYLGLKYGNNFERPIFDMINNYGIYGGLARKIPFRKNANTEENTNPNGFEEYYKKPISITENDLVYSKSNSHNFLFENKKVNSYQKSFLKKIGKLCKINDIFLTCFKIPTYIEKDNNKVIFPTFWSKYFFEPVTYMGIQSNKIFFNIDQNERKKFYTDSHLNANGQYYLSETVAPVIASLYANNVQ